MLGDSVKRRSRPSGGRSSESSHARSEKDERRLRRAAITLSLILAPFLIGYLIAVFVMFPAPEVARQGIAVPSLIGMTVEDARRELSTVGLGGLEITRLPHPDAREGTITAQSPLADQHLHSGQDVQVAVSAGPPHVTVPDVAGFPVDRAGGLLSRLGFTVIRETEHSNVEQGRVLRTDPPAGSTRTIPSRVTIVVSAGEPPGMDPDTGRAERYAGDTRWPGRHQ